MIRIGRSTDNHVILYSAVVSRHHVEIRRTDSGWEIVNLGANGTYLDGKRITQVPVEDGVIIRLARSGPNVQIHLGARTTQDAHSLLEEKLGQRVKASVEISSTARTNIPDYDDQSSVSSVLASSSTSLPSVPASLLENPQGGSHLLAHLTTSIGADEDVLTPPEIATQPVHLLSCCQQYAGADYLFCLECGRPLKPIGVIGDYQVVKTLEQDELSMTHLVWNAGQTFLLKMLAPEWVDQSEVVHVFEQEARQLLQLNHAALPKYREVFRLNGHPCLVMESVYGQVVQELVSRRGSFSQPAAIALLLEVCDVLDYLHGQVPPVLHQNLNPKNLIQRSAPTPTKLVITGFTPARHLIPFRSSTEYIAPEQQQGQASPASDLYALGLVAAYLLTGKAPSTFYAQREQGLRFYAEYIPGITRDLATVLRKLTNPQPEERFASAKEVKVVLQGISSFLPAK